MYMNMCLCVSVFSFSSFIYALFLLFVCFALCWFGCSCFILHYCYSLGICFPMGDKKSVDLDGKGGGQDLRGVGGGEIKLGLG